MRSHPVPVVIIAMSLAGAPACNKEGPPGPEASPKPEPTMSAAELCDAVYDAPVRHLAARCSAGDKELRQHRYLVGLSTEARTQCTARLGALASRGTIRLRADAARRCGQALESMSWKETLAVADVTRLPECRALVAGTQPQGQACESTLECAGGLVCSRASGAPQGTCGGPPPAGAPCERILLEAMGEQRVCGPDAACATPTSNRFYSSALGGHSREHEAHIARQKALRDANEFGLIGLLNSGAGAGPSGGSWGLPRGEGIDATEGARGEGIGLGSIGGLWGSDVGFGSGQGRLGGSRSQKPPRLKMGAVSVSGRLPPEVIQRIVRQNFGRFRLCYENGLRNNPTLGGRVSVRFVIGRDGAVSNVSGAGSDLPDSGVVSCVTRAFYGLSFPQPEGGIVTVTYPILFEPPEGAVAAPRAPVEADAGAPALADAGAQVEADVGSGSGSQADGGGAAEPASPSGVLRAVEEGKCAALAKVGAPCANGEPCDEGLACRLGQCVSGPSGLAGATCERPEDCERGLYCDFTPDPGEPSRTRGACAARRPAGAVCTSSFQCDGVCVSDKCVAFCGSR